MGAGALRQMEPWEELEAQCLPMELAGDSGPVAVAAEGEVTLPPQAMGRQADLVREEAVVEISSFSTASKGVGHPAGHMAARAGLGRPAQVVAMAAAARP